MKLRILLLITPLLTISVSLFAKPILLDSVGIENLDGKKVILHKLDPKDNYYSIGRRYNVKPADIIKFNNNAALKIGDIIKVPTDKPFLEDTKSTAKRPTYTVVQQQAPKQVAPAQGTTNNDVNTGVTPQQYKVSAGETLYSIAKRFNSTVDNIMKINGLTSSTVVPGQVIQVKSNVTDTPPPVVGPVVKRDSSPIGANQDSANAERRMNANRLGLFEKNEKGVATWMDEPGLDPNKKLVLHRTAPVGTVIKITNPMTNLSTFAKVVSNSFSDNETNKDVILIMTKSVAESIGALDKRVHVNISYGSPNE